MSSFKSGIDKSGYREVTLVTWTSGCLSYCLIPFQGPCPSWCVDSYLLPAHRGFSVCSGFKRDTETSHFSCPGVDPVNQTDVAFHTLPPQEWAPRVWIVEMGSRCHRTARGLSALDSESLPSPQPPPCPMPAGKSSGPLHLRFLTCS